MTQIIITVPNKSRIISVWRKAPDKLQKGIAQALNRTGLFASGKVKETITAGTGMWKPPIDTGAMRRGIQPSGMAMFSPKVYIRPSSATPYARYVHEGTYKMRARPFFDITKRTHEKIIRDFFAKELKKVISSLLR